MNKKLKVILIFLFGWFSGVLTIVVIALFAMYSNYRHGGSPLVEPKMYGDVRIYHWNSGDELEHQMGLGDWIIVENDKECFIALNFDKRKQFSGFSFWNKGNEILDYAIPQNNNFASVCYGTLEQNLSWIDYNSDGIFDIQHHKNDNIKKILIDEEWVKIPESGKVVVVNGNNEIEYDFNYEKGKWLPVEDSEVVEDK